MKKKLFTLIVLCTLVNLATAQKIEEIQAIPLQIGYEKTLHLIFPAEVKYCNTGNDHILAEKVGTQPNIVRIIAAEKNFSGETNLSIVTADTKFYSYVLSYNDTARISYNKIGNRYIEPHVLPVGKDKTMYLIFPKKIIYEDHGSEKIQVEKADGVDNILAIRATESFYRDTNISIVTAGGVFYTFSLCFALNPEIFTFVVDKQEEQKIAILDDGELNTIQKNDIHQYINKRPPLPLKLKDRSAGVDFEVNNIFIHKDILLFRLSLMNHTQIDYTIDFMRFYIQDAKKSKKTAIQQLEQEILFTFDHPEVVPSHENRMFIVALNKFTIPDKKRLIIEIQEKNGGRHFFFKMKNRHILKAEEVFRSQKERIEEEKVNKILQTAEP